MKFREAKIEVLLEGRLECTVHLFGIFPDKDWNVDISEGDGRGRSEIGLRSQ